MPMRIGINGFGRIGRLVFRAAFDEADLEVVAVNDIADPEILAYLLQFDSIHGLMQGDVALTEDGFSVDGEDILVLREAQPEKLPWKDLGVDLVIDASGRFTNRQEAEAHLRAGATRVIITAPAKGVDATFVIGVNDELYDPQKHTIISTASCTTNSLAVVAKILHDNFQIERGMMTTMHAYTNGQVLLDKPASQLRRSRAAAINLVPTTTGAARMIGEVIPELAGRLDAMAVRCPVPAGSLLDLTVLFNQEVEAEVINNTLEDASQTERLQDILLVSGDALVSTDIVGTSFSAIVDTESTMALGHMAKVLVWYDNEWGYSSRVVDMALIMANQ